MFLSLGDDRVKPNNWPHLGEHNHTLNNRDMIREDTQESDISEAMERVYPCPQRDVLVRRHLPSDGNRPATESEQF